MTGKAWWRDLAARRPNLQRRSRILHGLRELFRQLEFIEVDTPALQVSPGLDAHIRPLATGLSEPFGDKATPLYLHTSPEFAMKKLLAGGEQRIYQIAHAWRDGERSPTHSPEFTMLEWYRAGEDYTALMTDCVYIMRVAAQMGEVSHFRRGSMSCDPTAQPEWLSVSEAFRRYTHIELMSALERPVLAAEMKSRGMHVGESDDWADLFHRVMLEKIEPRLGGDGRACILSDYPLMVGAYAKQSALDPRLAERFELYVCGVELANGCTEIPDPDEQRRRFEADIATAQRLYGSAAPVDEELMAALAEMPAAAGIALGVDRLVMLACGAETVEEVMWAPVAGG